MAGGSPRPPAPLGQRGQVQDSAAMGGSSLPPKKPMRSVTEYIRSPQQQVQSKLEQNQQTKHQVAAKNFFRQAEAQGVADMFRQRIEQVLDEEVEDWTVVEYLGDLVRKAFIKLRVNEEDFVHIYAQRLTKGADWTCKFAPFKAEHDPLDQNEEDYEDLPERAKCGDKLDLNACSLEGCTLM